jgi:cytochrome c oxidase cbb3-type subunit III
VNIPKTALHCGQVRLLKKFLILACAAISLPLVAEPQSYNQSDIDSGAALYAAQCYSCHGAGDGVPGIDLRTGQFRHATSDQDLLAIVRNGIPGTAMPAHGDLTGKEVLALVAYIRNMRDYNAQTVKLGNPARGKEIFEGEGHCQDCHRVNGKGSRLALDLSNTGALHPAAYLEGALLNPQADEDAQPQNQFLRAVKKDGSVVTGRRLNEDTFTIQLLDDHQNLVSLEKSNLKSLTVVKSVEMPSVKGKLSDEQISDLVAYLASLKVPGRMIDSAPITPAGAR